MLIVTLLEALELGLIYSILALGVFLSFRTLNTPDLTVDGSIVTGAAISAVVCTAAADLDPAVQGVVCILGLVLSFLFGMGAGAITALLNTKLKIQPLLAGILVMLGIYSINLRIQGKANINLSSRKTIYSMMDDAMGGFRWSAIVLGVLIAAVVIILMYGFLKTRLGFALRATGDNEDMVRAAGSRRCRSRTRPPGRAWSCRPCPAPLFTSIFPSSSCCSASRLQHGPWRWPSSH